MTKRYFTWIIQLMVVLGIYYVLTSITYNKYIIISVLVGGGVLIILIRMALVKNDADLLDIVLNLEKFNTHIEKFEESSINKYNILKAYGYSYAGDQHKATSHLNKVDFEEIKKNKNLVYNYYVIKLHQAYIDKDIDSYTKIYNDAKVKGVFKKSGVTDDTFYVHLLLLKKEYSSAEQLLLVNIPLTTKRILIIEAEYLLALAYYEQSKLQDCFAVCEFVVKKGYETWHAKECKVMYDKLNR